MTAAETVAFELRAEFAESFAGGSVSPGGRTVNLADALKEGNGQIVVNPATDPGLFDALTVHPALKRVGASEDAPTVSSLDDASLDDLKREASRLGLKVEGRSRDAYKEAIRAAQSGAEGGE